jgi:hypothetical protein
VKKKSFFLIALQVRFFFLHFSLGGKKYRNDSKSLKRTISDAKQERVENNNRSTPTPSQVISWKELWENYAQTILINQRQGMKNVRKIFNCWQLQSVCSSRDAQCCRSE